MGRPGEGQSQGFSGLDELTQGHPPLVLAWIQAIQLLRGPGTRQRDSVGSWKGLALVVKIIMWPLVVFQEVGGATLSGNSDGSVPQVTVLLVASRWPPLLSLANASSIAEGGSATWQVRSGASTAFLGVDPCHPPQAPRQQQGPPTLFKGQKVRLCREGGC